MPSRCIFFLLFLPAFLPSLAQQEVESRAYGLMLDKLLSHSVPEITARQAALKAEAVFIDARERKEYEVSHIHRALWVGYETFDSTRLAGTDKEREVIVYCSVGYRSEKIAEKLAGMGFGQVFNLYGGIFEWVNRGYPVYDEHGQTENVHAYNHNWGLWLHKGNKVY